jgi:cytidine deaminase
VSESTNNSVKGSIRQRAIQPAPPPEILEEPARLACRRSSALSPDSPRGAALLTRSGQVFAAPESTDDSGGGVSACAERAAVYQAVMNGRSNFTALLLRGGKQGRGDAGPPCGLCLQVLLEFSPGARVWWGTATRPRGGMTVRELLPGAFGSEHLSNRERPSSRRRRGL